MRCAQGWDGLLSGLEGKRLWAMRTLRDSLPESDLDCYPAELFLRFAEHALFLEETVPWCPRLGSAEFTHYVLAPRVNDEDLSFHRELFYRVLWPRVRDLPTMEDRVLEVNRWCHEHASYQAQDERTASPLTVYRCGSGRCGEESAFLVSALRSVGIPARQIYAPRWSHCNDNHAWVEALCGGVWRYLGACEPEPVLDRGWFTTAASRTVLAYSRVFGRGGFALGEEALGRWDGVTWLNQTARYADTRVRTFRALVDGQPAAGTEFHLQILNEASYHTVAVLTADGRGIARAALGKGSLHVLARLGALTAEGACGEDGGTFYLGPPPAGDTPWIDFDFQAPEGSGPAPPALRAPLKALRADILRQGEARRKARLDSFFQPGREGWADLLRAARGNCGELLAFLRGEDGERRERLVRTLSDKDLRDVAAEVLEEHFACLPPRREGVPEEVYWNYAACPRMAMEPLTPWRGRVLEWLDGWAGSPEELRQRIDRELKTCPPAYGGLYWPPGAALEAGKCDRRSKDVLFTAALRALGVPARLRSLDGAPEYWVDGRFCPLFPEEPGELRVTCPDGETPRCGHEWSISRWTGAGWGLLAPEGDRQDSVLVLDLPAGRYRLVTSVRLPGGGQLASRREVELRTGEVRTVPLRLRPWALGDLLTRQELPSLGARTLDGREIPDLFRMGGGPVLALWLEEGGEPTEHVLNELLARVDEVGALPARVLFLLRGRDSLTQPTLAKALRGLEGVQVLLDDWAYDLEAAARHLGRDPDCPPLAVVGDGAGQALYSASGYRAGGVGLLLRVVRTVCAGQRD